MKHPVIPTQIVPDVSRAELSPRQIEREFMRLVDAGSRFEISGSARKNPQLLLSKGQKPKHRIELFDTVFYLTNVRQFPELRFCVAYVVQPDQLRPAKHRRAGELPANPQVIHARIFYKDLSLAWRSASHFSFAGEHFWIGKGDVHYEVHDGFETISSDESTTDLPLEMQSALESLLEVSRGQSSDPGLIELVLRKSPSNRVEPYADFSEPRKAAAANRKNLIYGGRSIAKFRRQNDPSSLWIASGFEPDFVDGVVARSTSSSSLYGGPLKRFRILSRNRKVQYYFVAGQRHVWIFPPQALTTELSSYGVRTISVVADEHLFIPGYEYHYYEETENGTELYSQIPAGFAGEICGLDEAKADATAWLDRIPVIQEFREKILKQFVVPDARSSQSDC